MKFIQSVAFTIIVLLFFAGDSFAQPGGPGSGNPGGGQPVPLTGLEFLFAAGSLLGCWRLFRQKKS